MKKSTRPGRSPTDCALDLDFLDPKGRERLPVETLARLEIADRQREVVDEELSRHRRGPYVDRTGPPSSCITKMFQLSGSSTNAA